MQQAITLQAQARQAVGKKVRALRKAGTIPAVLYGHGISSRSLAVEARTFGKVYKAAGESTLLDLVVDTGAPVKVLIHDVAKDPLTLKPVHVDFYQVSMTEKLTVEVPLKFLGEAPAVKEFGAVLVKNLQQVKAECLPQDLVHEIEVDLGALKALGNTLTVAQIYAPAGMRILNKPEETVVLAQAPRVEEEVQAAPSSEKDAIEQIKTVADEKKAKKEEEAKAAEAQEKK